MKWRRGFPAVFASASIAVSQIWLPIGHFAFHPTRRVLSDFPALSAS
jgi:hypothetical protein